MSKAYLNALWEEGSRKEIFDWLVKLDKEVDELHERIADMRDDTRERSERE